MNKLQEIELINEQDKLSSLLNDLLVKMGLSDVNRQSAFVTSAKEVTQLEERINYFICVKHELSGKDELILDLIKKFPNNIDSIYIVSSKEKISNYFKN